MCGFDETMGNVCSLGPKGFTISITISMPEPPSTRLGGMPDRCENVRDFRSSRPCDKMDKEPQGEDGPALDYLKPDKKQDEKKDNEDERRHQTI